MILLGLLVGEFLYCGGIQNVWLCVGILRGRYVARFSCSIIAYGHVAILHVATLHKCMQCHCTLLASKIRAMLSRCTGHRMHKLCHNDKYQWTDRLINNTNSSYYQQGIRTRLTRTRSKKTPGNPPSRSRIMSEAPLVCAI